MIFADRTGPLHRSGLRTGAALGLTLGSLGTLVFGYENTIEFIDPIGMRATVIMAANGPQTVTSPLFPSYTGSALGTNRAIEQVPGHGHLCNIREYGAGLD